jgi:hypothetical protein
VRERCCASSISRVEADTALLAELDRRGYRLDEWTWAMGLDVGTGAGTVDRRHFDMTSVTGAAAVSTPDAPDSAGQGLVGGVRNTVPRIIGCNIAVN